MSKLAILGAGGVGATIAYAALIRGVASHVALYDVNRAKADAEALDLAHGAAFFPEATIEASDDLAVCAGAAVVVLAAGAKQKPGQTRLDLAAANVAMLRDLLPRLQAVAPDAILLLVSNPVDVLTAVALRITGLQRERVFGSGTVLDSARFRSGIAARLKVAPQSVHATIVGEHGDSSVPLWSTANVGGVPLSQWAVPGHGKLTVRDRTEIFVDGVKGAAGQIIAGKGATTFAIGLAVCRILSAIFGNAHRALPVSTRLPAGNAYGIEHDVCLSLPCLVGTTGAEPPLTVPMNDAELAGLRHSAEVIADAIRSVGF